MSKVLVVGGGFAGVWAAAGAVRAAASAGREDELQVTLVDSGDDMVIRPRLYEASPESMRVPLDRILGPIGVRRVAATVTTVDTDRRCVGAISRDGSDVQLPYDRLVLATGSRVIRAGIDGAEHLFDVDTLPAAAALDGHLARLRTTDDDATSADGRRTVVVIGAGFTGLELATELAARLPTTAGGGGSRVVLVERSGVVGPELGPGPRPQVLEALDEAGVELYLGAEVVAVDPDGVTLADSTRIPARTVVWTAGMRASGLTDQIPGERDSLGRLVVDEFLGVRGVPGVYAAGDTAAAQAEGGHVVMQSCQHAVPQGKHAGANVAADLLGTSRVPFAPDPYVTCLDLGAYGAVLTTGWDREVAQTREEAKALKRSINSEWIYPPVDNRDLIIRYADHRTTWPTATVGQ